MISWRNVATTKALIVALGSFLDLSTAMGQSLKVLPVNIQMPHGQMTATLTVINEGTDQTAIQIRAYSWNQPDGADQLTTSDEVLASPPIASIPPGATQVVRVILRRKPTEREATYRILLDQIPPPAVPGAIQIVLRMSIPIFAQPASRAAAHLQFRIERDAEKAYLVGTNDGLSHEAIRDIVLVTRDGRKLTTEPSASPYILAGVTRRWPITLQGWVPQPNESLRLTARAVAGGIEQQVRVAGAP